MQWLRKDYRTARIPIGVMARSDDLYGLRYAFEERPADRRFPADSFHRGRPRRCGGPAPARRPQLRRSRPNGWPRPGRSGRHRPAWPAPARPARSGTCCGTKPPSIRGAGQPGADRGRGRRALANIGTPKSQTALVDFASQNARPLADRQAAAAAFAAAVQARGLNLTQQQIAAQFERYNASEKLDCRYARRSGVDSGCDRGADCAGELTKAKSTTASRASMTKQIQSSDSVEIAAVSVSSMRSVGFRICVALDTDN